MKKKYISLFLALVMVIGLAVPTTLASSTLFDDLMNTNHMVDFQDAYQTAQTADLDALTANQLEELIHHLSHIDTANGAAVWVNSRDGITRELQTRLDALTDGEPSPAPSTSPEASTEPGETEGSEGEETAFSKMLAADSLNGMLSYIYGDEYLEEIMAFSADQIFTLYSRANALYGALESPTTDDDAALEEMLFTLSVLDNYVAPCADCGSYPCFCVIEPSTTIWCEECWMEVHTGDCLPCTCEEPCEAHFEYCPRYTEVTKVVLDFPKVNKPVLYAGSSDVSDPKEALVLNKKADPATSGSNYVLTLEAFTVGRVEEIQVVKPNDIVVIVDQSGSMLQKFDNTKLNRNTVDPAKAQHGLYYLAYGDTTVTFLFYENGKWYYYDTHLNKSGDASATQSGGWDNYVKDIDTIRKSTMVQMTSQLWDKFERNGIYKTRYGATYDALYSFIDSLKATGAEHRIAITGFGSYFTNHTNGLVNVKTNSAAIYAAVDAIHTNERSTFTQLGLEGARDIFANTPVDLNQRGRLAVFFCDGAPAGGSVVPSRQAAYTIINTHKAEIYSVGAAAATASYMEYVSSNYPDDNGTSVGDKKATKYYFSASNTTELNNAFQQIAQDASSATLQLSTETVIQDVVADSFVLPEGASKNDIKVYTAPCNGKNAQGEFTFGTPVSFADAVITLSQESIEGSTQKRDVIKVSNYNFKENYVAIANNIPRGNKLIIEIPMNVRPGFLGGDQIDSNTTQSGVYVPDSTGKLVLYKPFEQPKVSVSLETITPNTQSKDIYLSQMASLAEVLNLGSYKVGNTTYQVDGINNAYVEIEYEIKEKGSTAEPITYTIPAGTAYASLSDVHWDIPDDMVTAPLLKADTTYEIKVTVKSVNLTTNTTEETVEEDVNVYKPEITFNDSSVNYNVEADYTANGGAVVWKHNGTAANTAAMGAAPTLEYAYSPVEGIIKAETPVKVTVTAKSNGSSVPTNQDITPYVTFYRDACTFDGCSNTTKTEVSATDANRINFVVHLNAFDLTITKNAYTNELLTKPDQSFRYTIAGVAGTPTAGFTMSVVLNPDDFSGGTASVTVKSLPGGQYTVTEDTDWSWRYTLTNGNGKIADASNNIAVFNNTRDKDNWLDFEHWVGNLFRRSPAATD